MPDQDPSKNVYIDGNYFHEPNLYSAQIENMLHSKDKNFIDDSTNAFLGTEQLLIGGAQNQYFNLKVIIKVFYLC